MTAPGTVVGILGLSWYMTCWLTWSETRMIQPVVAQLQVLHSK